MIKEIEVTVTKTYKVKIDTERVDESYIGVWFDTYAPNEKANLCSFSEKIINSFENNHGKIIGIGAPWLNGKSQVLGKDKQFDSPEFDIYITNIEQVSKEIV